eukprot:Phypoly_transcript_24989.p1 GENE.Phypoly_transcript_24989~~Phypoly_transcript_24989.p1  ORF type:complete len:132 (+),score=22.55 Phypoly_transcript_24989:94-489(+)
MGKTVIVPEPSAFDNILEEQVKASTASGHPLFVYVIGKRDESGKSWCPDCVASDPIVFAALKNLPDYTLVEAGVIRAEYKNNPSFPYRTHAQLQIKGVPTFIHWTKDGPQKRLVEEELFKPEPIAELLKGI